MALNIALVIDVIVMAAILVLWIGKRRIERRVEEADLEPIPLHERPEHLQMRKESILKAERMEGQIRILGIIFIVLLFVTAVLWIARQLGYLE